MKALIMKALIPYAFLAVACTGSDSRTLPVDSATVRDSGGVTIVENKIAEPDRLSQWVVDSTPSLIIGVESGDPNYEFSEIKGIRQLANGMYVVLNGLAESAFEFRFFDSTGKFIATHGRRGEGPGEYRWVSSFGDAGGDTVVAVDFPLRRISWLSASRGYLRSISSDETLIRETIGNNEGSGITESMIPLDDSLYAIRTLHRITLSESRTQRAYDYHIVDLRRRSATLLDRLSEGVLTRIQLSSVSASVGRIGAAGAMHIVDRQRKRLCAAVGEVAEIKCVDSNGARRVIRWANETAPYTAEDRTAAETQLRKSMSSDFTPADAEKRIAAYEWPSEFPPFAILQNDTEGNFWILEYRLDPAGQRSQRFRVLDPDGRIVAFATAFPISRTGLSNSGEIGSASVLRAVTSPNGAPVVGVFRIRKK